MVKKVFALASVTALSGLMVSMVAAGCSSTTVEGVTDDGSTGTDAKVDAPKIDASIPDTSVASVCPTTDPITTADLDMGITWAPPKVSATACNQDDITKLKAAFAVTSPAPTLASLQASLSATCSPCVFTQNKTDTNWQLFVIDGANYFDNIEGACFTVAAGTTGTPDTTCGKARFDVDGCLFAACSDQTCQTTSAVLNACQAKAFTGACKDIGTAYTGACDETTLIGTTVAPGPCASIYYAIAEVCGGGADGGLDASP